MANELRPLIEILRDLRALSQQKASGFFFVVTEDNHSCTIRLHDGQVEDVVFSRHRGDEAVQLLARVPGGRARFQADPGRSGPVTVALGAASQAWLAGGFEQEAPAPPLAPEPAAETGTSAHAGVECLTGLQRSLIERIALDHFGPIADLLCEEALGRPGSIDRALVELASNLPARDQEDSFLAEARRALGLYR
ncbi:hypothetical protein [Dyella lutea]|uniref:DUF8082 domain-containing protein n=1 Tax=Dyella lutea TaxID=2950441 RepID=A0ABT1FEM7_9GAMM|nr:hypothetical protein [Dyella lutea]MCP1375840.1 hypothetical protein [Dyella lutea]